MSLGASCYFRSSTDPSHLVRAVQVVLEEAGGGVWPLCIRTPSLGLLTLLRWEDFIFEELTCWEGWNVGSRNLHLIPGFRIAAFTSLALTGLKGAKSHQRYFVSWSYCFYNGLYGAVKAVSAVLLEILALDAITSTNSPLFIHSLLK